MTILMPQGFYRVACSELFAAKAEAYWHPGRNMLMIKVTSGVDSNIEERLLGPFRSGGELEALHHVINDIFGMKGRYGAC
jgi:hypothetical protein